MADRPLDLSTRAVHAGDPFPSLPGEGEELGIPGPIALASVYAFRDLHHLKAVFEGFEEGSSYGRYGTRNHAELERALANLEGGPDVPFMVVAQAAASGMAAILLSLLSAVKTGEHVVATQDCYGGTQQLLQHDLPRLGVRTSFVDTDDLEAVERAIEPSTRVLLAETISNPTIKVADLPRLAALAKERGLWLFVDSTFPTPMLHRPLTLGPHVVVLHSLTKYLSGHADVLGGAVVAHEDFMGSVKQLAMHLGPTLAPLECWLTLRGLRTLPLRMERHCDNARRLAEFLARHPRVRRVYYPTLPTSPYRERARQLLPKGAGGMLSFEIPGGIAEANAVITRLRLIKLMPSLGHTITIVSHPSWSSHRGLSPQEKARAGVSDGLIRVSAGLEHFEDLQADLEQALDA